ncbi:Hypothetical protein Rta_06340 [Ramlibacter tataouinensis TTB310]|uniref:DUF3618 domain-containing protein n=1 Tax=Ramlibacter tataouinensis (strain ATCC BAA-407 / DSM 14655 / LMG 21543 / TTB310) TaxID=365046 RepID=F5XWV1_RAMTT|nr:Hypothetical protein Rta_06340 [Ramlibacter tataouinensis TTB310]
MSLIPSMPNGLAAEEGGGMPAPMLDEPASADALAPKVAAVRERIHSFAGMVHQAIDKLEQKLNSTGESVTTAQARYSGQARQYGEKLGGQISARPLQSAGMALGAGVILSKVLFRRAPKVRVVKVPVHTPSPPVVSHSPDRRATRWMHEAGAGMRRLGALGQEAVGRMGAAAGLGLAGTKATSSTLRHKASTWPLQMRLAGQRLLAGSQGYGTLARAKVQAHPVIGIGAVLGVGMLLRTVWLQRRRPAPDTAYVSVDADGNGVAWGREPLDVQSRARGMISSRPATSAVVLLGLGALVGLLLKRR